MKYRILLGITILLFCASTQGHANDDCIGATPQPVLSPSAGQPQEKVTSHGATEIVEAWVMDENVSVTITQTDCEDYRAVYVFTVRGDVHSAQDRSYWLIRGSRLLRELPMVPDQKKERELVAKAVEQLSSQTTNQIALSGSDTVDAHVLPSGRATVIRVQSREEL
jgi:hypothetical protein